MKAPLINIYTAPDMLIAHMIPLRVSIENNLRVLKMQNDKPNK